MTKFILGKKLNMTQIFQEDGKVVPVTTIKAGPCLVTQIKTKEKDGYKAVQIGFGQTRKISKPLKGHLKGLGNFRHLREFRIIEHESWNMEQKNRKREEQYKIGDEIKVDIFQLRDKVQVSGISKGKGFQGVVKRWGFKGGPASHGHKDQLRMPGSIGATDAARVLKGKKMAGRMGGVRKTVKGLEVVEVDKDKRLLMIKGAVPGGRNALLEIRSY
jgi:large subunit ribosomal protein L3